MFNQFNQQYIALEQQGVKVSQLSAQAQHQNALIQEKLNHNEQDITEQNKSLQQLTSDQEKMAQTLVTDINSMERASRLTNITTGVENGVNGQVKVIDTALIYSHTWLTHLQHQVAEFEQAQLKHQTLSSQLLSVQQAEVLSAEQVKYVAEQLAQLQLQINGFNEQLLKKKELRVTFFVSLGYIDFDKQSSDFIRKTISAETELSKTKLLALQQQQQAIQAQLQQLLGQELSAKQYLIDNEQAQKEAEQRLTTATQKSHFSYQAMIEELTELSPVMAPLSTSKSTLENIDSKLSSLAEQLKIQQVKLGQIQQAINHDKQNKSKQQSLLTQIETAQINLDDLSYLNSLIGSADGAKFRKFAQGLTLNHLVYLANEQLNKLDGRYQLQCQQSETLSLEVLDTWQGDSVRDTKTLSGGESFLVSLALALALSDLVSNKTSIDSLFLDEGFGTLDNDTLEIALDALDNLNATGKMIGIISHVEALKERIAVQVKVEKQSGLGVSCLDKQFAFSTP